MADSVEDPNETAAPPSQTPGHPSFRRQRASRACQTCHGRKVRCDAASLGVPCTNCVAFSIECKIPPPKRKKSSLQKDDVNRVSARAHQEPQTNKSPARPGLEAKRVLAQDPRSQKLYQASFTDRDTVGGVRRASLPTAFAEAEFTRAPIRDAGRVAYLGECSNLSLLIDGESTGGHEIVHYPLPDVRSYEDTSETRAELDELELKILHERGAFLLPTRAVCDDLIESYFRWVAPVVPVINQQRFLAQWHSAKEPPSLLLLQAVLLAGSRVCKNPQILESQTSKTPAALTFYKRAKALYDSNYEEDRVTIVQALILMSWYCEAPEDVTKNVFYWTRLAIVVAQGSGMHRSVEQSQLSRADKRLWKRIWWTLFTRDRSVAVAFGRPVQINTDDSDIEMLEENDFDDGESEDPSTPSPYYNHTRAQFFMQYLRLCEIMGIVLAQQYSVASKARRPNAIDLTHSDMALADWLQNCPREIYWESSRHTFLGALLHANYYTTLCLLHRAHMAPSSSKAGRQDVNVPANMAYPSRNIALQAAEIITSIVQQLQAAGQLRYAPAFIVYSLFSAMIMHVYQMRSSMPSVIASTQEKIQLCMSALQEISNVWLVAKTVRKLFELILGNKTLEDKLQQATGKQQKKVKVEVDQTAPKHNMFDHDYNGIPMAYNVGPPAMQMSYERSRPQTPNRDLPRSGPSSNPMQMSMSSNDVPRVPQDGLAGSSMSNTRAATPFHLPTSVPATPPMLHSVTRDSPLISQQLLDNFQPGYLFPDSAQSSTSAQQYIGDSSFNIQYQDPNALQSTQTSPWAVAEDDAGNADQTWGATSLDHAPIAPTTLNTQDWYQFFGIENNLPVFA